MLRIAIISDNHDVQRGLRTHLTDVGYTVITRGMTDGSVEDLFTDPPDLWLMDLTTATRQGITSCRTIKRNPNFRETPLLVIAELEATHNAGFSIGIDDFIFPPANVSEIAFRIKFALWKANKVDAEDTVKIGDLVINIASYQVTAGGRLVELTYKEYELLKFLATHRGRVYSREALLERVWGEEYYGGTRTVDVHIRRLRAKLTPRSASMIETVRNVGYRFRA